jgi:hypothetical protein
MYYEILEAVLKVATDDIKESLYSLIGFPETAIIQKIIPKQIEYIADNMIYLSMDRAVIACEFKEEI